MKTPPINMRMGWLIPALLLLMQCSASEHQSQLAAKYEAMRERVLNDSSFMALVEQKVDQGDTSMTRLKSLLHLPYDKLVEQQGIDSIQIENMILQINLSLDVLGKFENIDEELQRKLRETDAKYSEELKKIEASRDSVTGGE